jgi:hypothetical protein
MWSQLWLIISDVAPIVEPAEEALSANIKNKKNKM